jgi:uncharacterized LabA/DUF88 family protein
MNRLAIYIDGSNVYHSLKKSGWSNDKIHFDVNALASKLKNTRSLVSVNYYCSLPRSTNTVSGSKSSHTRQQQHIDKLIASCINVRFAHLMRGKDGLYYEKNLDTMMTVDMLMSAFRSEFDSVMLVTNDGDFAEAANALRELGVWVEVAFFKNALSFNLRKSANITKLLRSSYFQSVFIEDKEEK